ncbi:MAG: HYR domain-containing protein, partial [Blastocatellia bacterium]
VSGAVTITDSVLTLGYYDGVDIQNFTGTISNLTISNNTITSSASTATSKAPGIRVIAFGSAGSAASVTTATINNNVVTNFPSDSGIMFQCGNATSEASPSSTCGSGANPINITNNNISGQSAVNRIGTQGILFNVQGVGTGHFNVSGNSVMHTSGNSISHNVFGDAVVTTTINNNTVVSNNTLGSQGIAGGTSFTTGFTSTPSLTVTITNNNVSQTDGNGILMVARDLATGSLNISVKNNTVAAPLAGVRPGIRVDAGNTMGDNDVCLDISGNTSAGSGGTQGIGLRKQGTDSAINAFGIEGMAATATPGVEAFVAGLNPAGGGVLLISGTSGFTSCGSAPLAMPIDPTGESNSSGQAQQHIRQSGSAPNLFARLNNWRHSIYSAFAAPTNLNLKAVGEWFSPTVEASNATSLTTTTTMNATLSGETVNKAISVIPPGKTVQIRFQVTVDSPFPAGVCTVSNQGSVSGSGFTTFLTNAATTTILLAPTIGACPTNITNNTDPGLCTAAVTFATPTATGCPMPTVTCSPASGSAFAKGTTTVTCTATNGVSPNSTCSFTVTVNDNQGPTFAGCPTNINANTAAGLCTAPVTYTAPTATDVCDGARTVTCSPASGSSFPKGTTTVTCTASDTSGNSNSCSFTVTVADNQGPTLTACPSNISLNTAAGLCTAVATYTAPTANDVCDGARTVTCSPASGTAFAKGTTTVTCTTSDTSGNNSSCSFTVTVADNQAPVVTCPGPISLTESSPGSGSATATFSATANDVCDGTRTVTCSPASGSSFPVGVTTVTCSASDLSGNSGSCSFTVTVGIACSITCPTNIVTNTAAGQCGANINYSTPTATGCGTVTCTPAANSFFPKGTTTVNCTTTAGPSCSFTVTVNDNQGPALTACPGNIALNTAAGLCTAVATYSAPTANDACDGARTVTCSPASGTAFAKGVTTVTCTTSDTSGNNSSCSFTVTVADNQAPTVTCPSPISLTESSPGSGSATATFSATANDVCDGTRTVTCSPASGSSFPVGVTTVNCSASDLSGNSGSCSFTVTVASACAISCPANINANTNPGQCTTNVSYSTPNPAGCGTVTCSPASGSLFAIGTTTVTCNTTAGPSCSFTVTVSDNQAPTVSCPANVNAVTNNTSGACSASGVSLGTASAVDNCGGTLTATGARSDSQPLSAPYPVGTTTITWSATDAAGNTGSCTQTVTVTNPNPVVSITGPASGSLFPINTAVTFTGSYTDNTGTHSANWMFDSATVAGTVNQTLKTVTASYSFATPGVYLVSLTVNDNCGGSGSANTIGGLDAFVVVYDPNGGFVTGGGWINSPAGAYVLDPSLTGKATFGFVSKYKRGSSVPTGETEFQFKAANLNFKSTVYEWLVVSGARAQYKGSGTINNTGDYRFILTAIDGQISGGGGQDKLRMKIWDNSGGGLVYDNLFNAPDSSNPTTVLGGGSIVIHAANGQNGNAAAPTVVSDFDGDGKTDLAVWDGVRGHWQIIQSSTGSANSIFWGAAADPYNDVMVPGDYDGDGQTDAAVFRRSTGYWLIKRSSDGQSAWQLWGYATDTVVPADYDGDGKTDIAVWRGSEGRWYIRRSSDNQVQNIQWGASNAPYLDVPVPADYDGDGKADLAVFRRSAGYWLIKSSADGSVSWKQLGTKSDVPVPADYDGDGKADVAIWDGNSTYWHIINSSDGSTRDVIWGRFSLGDIATPGDFDGDGIADIAVWRSSAATWYIIQSQTQTVLVRRHGAAGNTPVTRR